MKKLIICFWFFMCAIFVQAQDTLNKFNSKGKKNGYWKVLLKQNADPTDSLGNAYFYGIELWDNGKYVFKFHKHKWKYAKVEYDDTLPIKGKPVLINGTFKWYGEKGILINEEVYKNGQPFLIKSYTTCADNSNTSCPFEVLQFDKRYNNIPGTYFYEVLSSYGNPSDKYWFRKGKRGWKVYKIKE